MAKDAFQINTCPNPESGFTLLEILIAIFIFAIVVTTILVSYRSVFSSVDAINRGLEPHAAAKSCLERMTVDLQSIHVSLPPEYKTPDSDDSPEPFRVVGDTVFLPGAEFQRLRFASTAHLPIAETNRHGRIAEIVYYVEHNAENRFVLKRSDRLYNYAPPEQPPADPVLAENVRSLTFRYFDQKGVAHDLWNSDSEAFGHGTPEMIGIKLELNSGSGTLLLETIVRLPLVRQPKQS